jgi:putative spermidine/putrescine transport system permease protein
MSRAAPLAPQGALSKPGSTWDRISSFLYLRPGLVLFLFLGPPIFYMAVVYLGSLSALLLNSFYHLDDYTGLVVRQFTLRTYAGLFTRASLDIVQRSAGMAAAVTVMDALLAFPLAYYMAHFASRRLKTLLYLLVMLPLWSSYLVRVYSWKLILAKEGVLNWFVHLLHLDGALNWILGLPVVGGPSLSVSLFGIFIVFVYVWLPYMILPINAALERVPKSMIEASGDLGARPNQTLRHVILPLAFPGVVAGSIFSFSLTLGDFIVPTSLGNSSYFIGQVVLAHQGTSGDIPLAAAFTMIPIVIMIAYLLLAKRLGAFDAL